MPSKAKYSHCTGIRTELAAARALVVRIPRLGGQSIKIKSYSSLTLLSSSLKSSYPIKFYSCFFRFLSSSISSISTPARFR